MTNKDYISREAVIEWLKDKDIIKIKNQEENVRRELAFLSSIIPQQPCEDCINRDDAIELIAGADETNGNEPVFCGKQVIKMLKSLPSVTPKARWIPCSERLPEREGWYLTSLGDKTYGGADVDMYCKGWVKYGTHVLAWMPLPEPYKESENKE